MLNTINDFKTMELFRNGKTNDIPYFEDSKSKELLIKIQPNSLEDLCAIFSLNRKHCEVGLSQYISNKKNYKNIKYIHPNLEKHLKSTFGVLVYQEQVIAILQEFGNFSIEESNLICKFMGKRLKNDLEKYSLRFEYFCLKNNSFINACQSSNQNPKVVINQLWNYLCDESIFTFRYAFAVKSVAESYWIAFGITNNF